MNGIVIGLDYTCVFENCGYAYNDGYGPYAYDYYEGYAYGPEEYYPYGPEYNGPEYYHDDYHFNPWNTFFWL